ncbi:hypothetical protein QN092_21440 (plasmid) [Proteus vulgaris]|uniref:hypothetical protein n=1 Tax=Proteus vulgaris TaxID=585 RepID=UPI00254050FF|nr:hypothetical protein [Proteus vulgaris]WIF74476.1 hypothetical protein QN092_21440 [Proteus vulgaris]
MMLYYIKLAFFSVKDEMDNFDQDYENILFTKEYFELGINELESDIYNKFHKFCNAGIIQFNKYELFFDVKKIEFTLKLMNFNDEVLKINKYRKEIKNSMELIKIIEKYKNKKCDKDQYYQVEYIYC